MQVFGLDFTSAPARRKPITCAVCHLAGETLHVFALETFPDFPAFEAFLARPGPWIAGLDFPFGLPRRLIIDLGWPQTWARYVTRIQAMDGDMRQWEHTLKVYRDGQPPGHKHHRRVTDRLADSRSPMMLYGVPVGRMFFRGAPRLLESGVSVQPCHPTAADRVVVEAYPALLARRWAGRRGYKSDNRRQQTPDKSDARRAIVTGLLSGDLRAEFGLALRMAANLADACVTGASGDTLDAVLCAAQAAWAYPRRHDGYGIPPDVDRVEGWIVDPGLSGGGGAGSGDPW